MKERRYDYKDSNKTITDEVERNFLLNPFNIQIKQRYMLDSFIHTVSANGK